VEGARQICVDLILRRKVNEMKLSEDQVKQFDEDGFLVVDNILDQFDIDVLLGAMDRVYAGHYNRDVRPPAIRKRVVPFGTANSVRWILNSRTVDADVWSIATSPRLGESAARLLRTPAVSIIEDQLLDKPDNGAPVNLHQDYSYWRFSTSVNMLTCWIALTDMTPDMGPVEAVRGSHRWGFAARPRELINGSEGEYLSATEPVMPQGALLDFVTTIVPRGGGIFMHGLTFHGSRGNHTAKMRRAMSLHWAAEDCRLDRTKLFDYDHPYLFTGLANGDRLNNRYVPQVYPSQC
jgi:ectoine hydroxylase-related dioxygenase (phytanoyl-CoA dioxygenase family)